jgi:pimeloyl-ACP methyl ester carboxylesterase
MSAPALSEAPVQLVDVGDCKLAHRVLGDGPDLVFVHGWPLHGLTWRHVLPHLADRYRCHVFDLPGTGASQWTPELSYRVRRHAERVARAVDVLNIDTLAFIGHDSGAAISRHAAALLGDRVWGHVMSGTEIPGHKPLLLQGMLLMAHRALGRFGFRTLLRSPALRRTSLGWGACFSDPDRAEGEFHALFGTPLLTDDRAFAGQLQLARDWDWADTDDLAEVHQQLPAPALLLWGQGDPYFPAAKARKMAAQFPGGARFVCRPDGRLFVHEEHPAWFAHEAGRFFDALQSDRAAG